MGLNVISCEGKTAVYATKPGRSAYYAASDFNGEMGVLKCAALLVIGGAAGAVFGYALLKEYETSNYATHIWSRFVKSQDNTAPALADKLPYSDANLKMFGAKFAEVAEDAAFDPSGGPTNNDATLEEIDLTATDLISELFKSAVTVKRL